MDNITKIPFYSIPLETIEKKIAKKNGKKNGNHGKFQLPLLVSPAIRKVINGYGESVIRVDGEIPSDLQTNKGDRFLFISYNQTNLTHGLHKYPAKFFPELPRWFITRYSKENDFILDPFTGSGTTNVEALLLRRHSVGIDVDPFSRFLAKVKCTPLNTINIDKAKKQLLRMVMNYHPSRLVETDIPVFPYRDNWFNKEIILELAYLKKVINLLEFGNDIKNFFKICLSSIIRAVSNADDNCTRTVIRKRLNKKVLPSDALVKFIEAILQNVPKMIEFSNSSPKNIQVVFPEDMDARYIQYNKNVFDLAVTSPPYANAVDYPRTHQLELYWLELAKGSLAPLKKKHIGTENVSSNDYKIQHALGIKEVDRVIKKIFQKDPRRAFIVYKYLIDMKQNLKEIFRVLKSGGRYVMVVGNNKIRGELFENWMYIMRLAEQAGFNVENYFSSEIIKHFIKIPREERINTDWILVLRK